MRGLQKYNGITGPKPASKMPKKTLATSIPVKLKLVDCRTSEYYKTVGLQNKFTINVEDRPQPIAKAAIQSRGWNNFEVIVAGT